MNKYFKHYYFYVYNNKYYKIHAKRLNPLNIKYVANTPNGN